MKKSLKYLIMLLASMPLFFTSCSDDDGSNPTITLQKIEFNGSDYIATVNITCDATTELDQISAIYYYGSTSASVSSSNLNASGTYTNAVVEIKMPRTVSGNSVGSFSVSATTIDGGSAQETFSTGSATGQTESFTAIMGGTGSTTRGSYLSIMDQAVYLQGDANLSSTNNNVEIVFTGTGFISASEATYANVKNNGKSATIVNLGNDQYSFTTSTGYEGTINIISYIKGQGTTSAEINITVLRTPL